MKTPKSRLTRLITTGAVGAVALTTLMACGGESSGGTPSGSPADAGPITLKIADWGTSV